MRLKNYVLIFVFLYSFLGVGQSYYTWNDFNVDISAAKLSSLTESEVLRMIDDVKELPSGYNGQHADSIYRLVMLSGYYGSQNMHVDHILILNQLVINYKSSLSNRCISGVYMRMASGYNQIRNYELAKSFYKKALNDSLEINTYTYCASEIALMHKNLGQYDMAIDYYKMALERVANSEYKVAYLNSLGFLYYLNENSTEAKIYYDQALEVFDRNNLRIDSIQYYIIQSNLLSLSMTEIDASAEEIGERLLKRDAFDPFPSFLRSEVYIKLFDFYKKKGNCSGMRECLDSLLLISKSQLSADDQGRVLYKNWQYYSSCGDLKVANSFAERYVQFRDSLFIQEQALRSKVEQIQIANYRDQSNSAELAKSELESSNSILKLLFSLAIFTTMILIVLFIVIFRNRKLREKRKMHYLNVKRTLLLEQQKAIRLESEKKEKDLENKRLELRNMIQGSELEAELIEELIKRLSSIRNNNDPGELVQVIQFLQSKQKARKLDEIISTHQDLVDVAFKTSIKENFPNLTDAEFQLIVMLRLGLTTKEIALFKNIEPASVRIYKNRLKNKLNLDKKEGLDEFIASL